MGLNEKFFKSADEEAEPFFNTVLYNGTTGSSITIDAGFAPDLVWLKRINNGAASNTLVDTLRGANSRIFSDTQGASEANGSFAFNSNGTFQTNNVASQSKSSSAHVAWCWKAGGAAVFNDEGDEDSYVSANVANGFSIVKGDSTATGSDVKTVGHGLDSAPELVIMKNINGIDDWFVYSSTTGVSKYLPLNTTEGTRNWSSAGMVVNSTEVGMRTNSTGTWSNMIAYCFHSVAGVSKVGSFVGTGQAGKTETLDFEPSWIMIKRTSSSGAGWYIIDNKRSTASVKKDYLQANSNGEEAAAGSGITFNIDGFTFSGASFNTSGATHIYYAIA
tara:strand:+ start:5 stop:1000 length:996 start_codon:yes stop_codon:yes gene_type:complete